MISAAITFFLWLPLTMLATVVSRALLARLLPAGSPLDVQQALAQAPAGLQWTVRLALLGPALLGTVVASASSGALVGRFGGRAGPKEALVGAVGVSCLAWVLTLFQGSGAGSVVILLPLALVVGASAWAGARLARPRTASGSVTSTK